MGTDHLNKESGIPSSFLVDFEHVSCSCGPLWPTTYNEGLWIIHIPKLR